VFSPLDLTNAALEEGSIPSASAMAKAMAAAVTAGYASKINESILRLFD